MAAKIYTHTRARTLRINDKKCTQEIAYRWSIIFSTRSCAEPLSVWKAWMVYWYQNDTNTMNFVYFSFFVILYLIFFYVNRKIVDFEFASCFINSLFVLYFVFHHNLSIISIWKKGGHNRWKIRSSMMGLLLSLHYGMLLHSVLVAVLVIVVVLDESSGLASSIFQSFYSLPKILRYIFFDLQYTEYCRERKYCGFAMWRYLCQIDIANVCYDTHNSYHSLFSYGK